MVWSRHGLVGRECSQIQVNFGVLSRVNHKESAVLHQPANVNGSMDVFDCIESLYNLRHRYSILVYWISTDYERAAEMCGKLHQQKRE